MKIEEDNTLFPPRKYYAETEEKFTAFTPNCRVLPANYFNEYNTFFTLKARYEPGENKFFPKGGFEIIHSEGGTYNYYLDEVIIHPFHLGMRRFFTKSENIVKDKVTNLNPGKRGRPKIDPLLKKNQGPYVPTGKQRGRKRMSDEDRATRDAKLAVKKSTSSGRRGRPKKQIV